MGDPEDQVSEDPIGDMFVRLVAEEDQARAGIMALATRVCIYREALILGGMRPDEAFQLTGEFQATLLATITTTSGGEDG